MSMDNKTKMNGLYNTMLSNTITDDLRKRILHIIDSQHEKAKDCIYSHYQWHKIIKKCDLCKEMMEHEDNP